MGYGDTREIMLNYTCPINICNCIIMLVVTYVIFNVKSISLARNSLRFKGLPDFLHNVLATILALKSERIAFKKSNRRTASLYVGSIL
jgi:hypothetical protein